MKVSWILAILFTLFIWMNSLLSGDQSSVQSGWIVNILDQSLRFISIHADETFLSLIVRKTAHFTEFFILAILWIYALKNKDIKIIYVLWITLGVAAIDEMIQLFIPGRSGNIIDISIDFAGSLFAYLIYHFIQIKKSDNISLTKK